MTCHLRRCILPLSESEGHGDSGRRPSGRTTVTSGIRSEGRSIERLARRPRLPAQAGGVRWPMPKPRRNGSSPLLTAEDARNPPVGGPRKGSSRMKKRKPRAALLVTLALVLGGSAAMAQDGKPRTFLPDVQHNGPQIQLPPEAQEARARIEAEVRRTGRRPPAPVWDSATNDFLRNPDGSVKWVDTNRTRPDPPSPPCMSTPGGCAPEHNPPPAVFCARLPKGCDER